MSVADNYGSTRISAVAGRWSTARLSAILMALPEALVFGIACLVRFIHVAASNFPIGDGGLFYLMVERLREDHYALPATVSYNGGNIPFAYPPLGFYLTALIADVTGSPVLEVMRFLPLALSIATVGAVWAFARSVLRGRYEVLVAVFAFGMLPLAYRYFIMGAGITRSPGLLFAVLTVWLTYLLCTKGRSTLIVPATLVTALTILSHPNAAWFAAYSSGLVVLFFGRDRRSLIHVAAVGVGAALLTSPWWLLIVVRHGLTPFIAAPQASNPGTPAWELLLRWRLTDEALVPIIAIVALVGLLICLRDRRWWLPTWLVATCVLDTRYAGTFAMVPLALLAGVGFQGLVELLSAQSAGTKPPRIALAGVAGWFALLSFAGSAFVPGPALQALPETQRDAMTWALGETPGDSTFLILAPVGASAGSESEWFPVLAERRSLGTYQGSEWLAQTGDASPWQRYDSLQRCAGEGVSCMDEWAANADSTFDYVYVREEGTELLRASLGTSASYTLAYHDGDVWIFAHH